MKRSICLVVTSLFLIGKGFGFFCTPCDWTGAYVGGNLGGAYHKLSLFDIDYASASGGTLNLDNLKFIGGGQLGYNYQFCSSPIICGVEASFDWVSGSSKYFFDYMNATISSQLQYFGTLHGRVGFCAAGFYLYFLGGAAYEKIKASWETSVDPPLSWHDLGKNLWGWTFGGGVEKCLTSKISLRVQVMNLRFPERWTSTNDRGSHQVMKADTLVGVLGINYRFSCFGWGR